MQNRGQVQPELLARGRQFVLLKSIEIRRRLMVCEIVDRQKACNPDQKTEFKSFDDVFDRLSAFQTFDTAMPTEPEIKKFNETLAEQSLDILKKMGDLESRLEHYLQEEAKKPRMEELVALESQAYQHSMSELKFLRQERGRQLNPEKLLCMIHGLDEETVLHARQEGLGNRAGDPLEVGSMEVSETER
ncbi:hypothetical protein AAMO2058_001257000 [Amorphochlora amoebiformis]